MSWSYPDAFIYSLYLLKSYNIAGQCWQTSLIPAPERQRALKAKLGSEGSPDASWSMIHHRGYAPVLASLDYRLHFSQHTPFLVVTLVMFCICS